MAWNPVAYTGGRSHSPPKSLPVEALLIVFLGILHGTGYFPTNFWRLPQATTLVKLGPLTIRWYGLQLAVLVE